MKLPRDASGADVIRALQRVGFVHSAVAPGTLKSILRQAGMTIEDFIAAL